MIDYAPYAHIVVDRIWENDYCWIFRRATTLINISSGSNWSNFIIMINWMPLRFPHIYYYFLFVFFWFTLHSKNRTTCFLWWKFEAKFMREKNIKNDNQTNLRQIQSWMRIKCIWSHSCHRTSFWMGFNSAQKLFEITNNSMRIPKIQTPQNCF